MIRWRQYDMTIALSPSCYRTVAIVLSHVTLSSSDCRVLAFSPSYYGIVASVLSHCRHRIVALSPWYFRVLAFSPSGF
ncbi:hypothetical protein DPMN_061032 [Dreissena polymorpha]|uniref:Uncharacterized protein n=1 Tax=Dreissena polymorpha TaxID=45954 RepID=A0A9D4HGQ6_DREPO|nr:hypothetical protein DPMN_061032 [Dreissena polymorpha]